ncbi:cytidylyltransferase domain-containing protein [Planctomicrobium sp. SH661]|uniref:cytidylyltransferase domain-containing protein n=1 Tax=Planctomicrobium sp. SH661 TaxID=3448124 RepID=UPI003F5CA24A
MSKASVIVPLRLNSKSIPKKNIRPLGGKPMCGWILEAAANANGVGQVVVSTEAQEIMDVISTLHLPVDFVRRPEELAGDKSTTESVMLHALDACQHQTIVLVQATSPLLTSQDIDAALDLFWQGRYDSLLSAVRTKAFFWTDDGHPINYDPLSRPMRQDFNGCLQENGAIYITSAEALRTSGCRLSGKIGVFEMSADTSVELDEPHDWEHVSRLLAHRSSTEADSEASFPRIKAVVCDVDGTLTDGGMYYGADGELIKKFNTRDAVGLSQLKDHGIRVLIVTAEDSPAVTARMKKLQISDYHSGIRDKVKFLDSFFAEQKIDWSEVGYFGDDLNDVPAMKKAKWVACPADACPEVQSLAHYRCTAAGGMGAVREACRTLLEKLN